MCKLVLNLHTSVIQTFHMDEEWNPNSKIIIAFKHNQMNTLLRKLLVWFNISFGLYLKLISEVNILEYWIPISTCVCHPILALLIPCSMSLVGVPMKHCVPIVEFDSWLCLSPKLVPPSMYMGTYEVCFNCSIPTVLAWALLNVCHSFSSRLIPPFMEVCTCEVCSDCWISTPNYVCHPFFT
jgi:hypothetical protein